jgi:hypothetical protein
MIKKRKMWFEPVSERGGDEPVVRHGQRGEFGVCVRCPEPADERAGQQAGGGLQMLFV